MNWSKIKVLVVDDSAFMRRVVSDLINSDPALEVVGTARNGEEALKLILDKQPTVVTMDVEMPGKDGISTVEQIMKTSPVPVVMLSSQTYAGAEATINALQKGAVDFVPKPSGSISLDIHKVKEQLISKIKVAAKARVGKPAPRFIPFTLVKSACIKQDSFSPKGIIAIGTSTGGPKALQEVLPRFPENLAASVLIVQHMPPGFTKSLADRLNSLSRIQVKEAEDQEELLGGTAYIAPGNYHMKVAKTLSGKFFINLTQEPPVSGHRPSVDVLFLSVAEQRGIPVTAVILTGMGQDGKKGMIEIKKAGGRTIAEDASTAVVYGMPKAAVEAGCVDQVVPLQKVGAEILKTVHFRK